MSDVEIEECLVLLRRADAMLLDKDEIGLAAHLSLVIERLAMRLPRVAPAAVETPNPDSH